MQINLCQEGLFQNHGLSTIMVIWIDLRIFEKDSFDLQFLAQRLKCWNSECDYVPNGIIGKVATWWVHIHECSALGRKCRGKWEWIPIISLITKLYFQVVFHNFPDLYSNLVHIHIICTIYIRDILDTSFIKPSLFIIINFEDPVEGYNYTRFYIDLQ